MCCDVNVEVRRQLWGIGFPFTGWGALEIKLRSSGLAASTLPTELAHLPLFIVFRDRVSLYSTNQSGTHYVV